MQVCTKSVAIETLSLRLLVQIRSMYSTVSSKGAVFAKLHSNGRICDVTRGTEVDG